MNSLPKPTLLNLAVMFFALVFTGGNNIRGHGQEGSQLERSALAIQSFCMLFNSLKRGGSISKYVRNI